MNKFLYIFILLLTFSCQNENKLEQDIENVIVDVEVERFDQLFANADVERLQELKIAYPFMFSKRYNDSVWINRINDTLQQTINKEVDKAFNDFSAIDDELYALFQHIKYYDKTFKEPRIITVTSDVDYRNKVIVTDSIALIALDNYLGSEHFFYENIYAYIKQNLNASQIIPDLADNYANKRVYQSKRKTLLDEMIYSGKKLYYKDAIIPFKSDAEKIGYLEEQLFWAKENEFYIWRHFVENEMLYSTNPKLVARFINPAPFSKFNLELDSESPGRLGQYLGWQIVRSYMENNDVTLNDMLTTEAEEIFNKAKFKPRK